MDTNIQSFMNKYSIKKHSIDRIADIAFQAQQFAKQYGKNQTIDGSIGIFKYDDDNLMSFPIIDQFIHALPLSSYSSYGPLKSTQKFTKGILALYEMEKYADQISVQPISGGLNGLHHAVHNFVDDETYCTALYPYWGPYENIMQELGYEVHGISVFRENDILTVDISILGKKLSKVPQKKIFFILNTPAQNPTGLSLTKEEIIKLNEILTQLKNKGKKVIVFLDSVYIHFTPYSMDFILDSLLNIGPVLINTSISKTLALYGFRAGGLCLLSKNRADHDVFIEKMSFSSRASIGSINHLAYAIIEFCSGVSLENDIKPLQKKAQIIMHDRANAFLSVLKKYGFTHYRYDFGFFITFVPPKNILPNGMPALEKKLNEKGIFFIPMNDSFRAGICSMAIEKIALLEKKFSQIF